MNLQKWFSIEIKAKPEAVLAVEFAFDLLDCLGTETDHLRKQSTDDVCVVGYFNELPDDKLLKIQLENALAAYDLKSEDVISLINSSEVENRDWLAEWKKHWKPTEVGRFIVTPPWETVNKPEKIVITIEPNMAFGTGTHETTQLCLAEIENLYQPEYSVLDVGTGTGLLAIAAAKLSSVKHIRILACDTDTDSVKIARENAELNGVGDQVSFYEGSITAEIGEFDLVLANLTIDVILPILPMLLAATHRHLVLSGILIEQRPLIEIALNERNVANFQIRELDEWISVSVTKN